MSSPALRLLGVIPARGGSKGFPRKNLAEFAGLPLIGHSIRCAERSGLLTRTIVSTDDPEIAEVAAALGGDVPFVRPADLADDAAPILPVLRHALQATPGSWDGVVLLQPTSPLRLPEDIDATCAALAARPDVDGAVTASPPDFNPVWQLVVEDGGLMRHLIDEGRGFTRRQDAPEALVLNGLVYAWRASFVAEAGTSWFAGRTALVRTGALRAVDIDNDTDLAVCRALLEAGLVELPWLSVRA